NGLQDAKERRMINADDKLRAVFGGKGKVSMFEMTKLVSKHMKSTAHPRLLPGRTANAVRPYFLAMAKKRSTAAKQRNVVAQARAGSGGSRAGTASAMKRVWENIKSLAGAVLIYLVIKTFLMEAFRI